MNSNVHLLRTGLATLALALFFGCTTAPVFVSDVTIYNGGDAGKPAVLSGTTVDNMGATQAVVFYRGLGADTFKYNLTERTEVGIGQFINVKLEKAEPNPRLMVAKFADVNSVNRAIFKKDTFPLSYSINFQSVGTGKIEEIIFVDALPDRFILKDVKRYWTSFVGGARYKDNGFDEMVWETKEKDGVNYLILKVVMKKSPMGSFGWMDVLSIKLVGDLNIKKE